MPCNAWNHRRDCNCGWGGVGYGRGQDWLAQEALRARARDAWASFVNPNARCPVCGETVFFYQSANGGRVFFDHLGAPWPKHPCTDTRPGPAVGEPSGRAGPTIPRAPWIADGWWPVAGMTPSRGRPTRDVLDSLAGGTVLSANDASEWDVLWPVVASFSWDGPVLMRQHPDSPYLMEFETVRVDGGSVAILHLVAVKNDPAAPTATLQARLGRGEQAGRDSRG